MQDRLGRGRHIDAPEVHDPLPRGRRRIVAVDERELVAVSERGQDVQELGVDQLGDPFQHEHHLPGRGGYVWVRIAPKSSEDDCIPPRADQDHMVVIPPRASAPDWLDACCWGCGTHDVALEADDRLLCRACRDELVREPAVDVAGLARHAYWESHALRCCWRCMTRAVDPDDEVGMCGRCREEIGRAVEEGAA